MGESRSPPQDLAAVLRFGGGREEGERWLNPRLLLILFGRNIPRLAYKPRLGGCNARKQSISSSPHFSKCSSDPAIRHHVQGEEVCDGKPLTCIDGWSLSLDRRRRRRKESDEAWRNLDRRKKCCSCETIKEKEKSIGNVSVGQENSFPAV